MIEAGSRSRSILIRSIPILRADLPGRRIAQCESHRPESALGPLTLGEAGGTIVALDRVGAAGDETPLLTQARAQFGEFIAGRRRRFDLPLAPAGKAFQHRV